MEIVRGFRSLETPLARPVVTLGNFDGVHLGHQKIIGLALALARGKGSQAVAYTFRPHPQKVLRPDLSVPLLTTYDEKLELLAALGIDVTVEEPFQPKFFNLSPREFFFEALSGKLHAQALVVGYDFSFGKGRQGHLDLLESFCKEAQIQLTVVQPQQVGEEVISSSKIRKTLLEGKIESAAALLSRPFSYQGLVIRGDQRGRTIGFPTANLKVEADKVVLPFGVYATSSVVGGRAFKSVTNVGVRPTFHSENPVTLVETHLLNTDLVETDLDLYDQKIEVKFHFKIREEMKFSGIAELKAQIQKDVQKASATQN